MTALEYMEKQLAKHRMNLDREIKRNAPEDMVENIKTKIGYYTEAVDALKGNVCIKITKPKKECDLKNKCGSCEFAKPTTWGNKPTERYVVCTNTEHVAKYCKRSISQKRAKTTPACKSYKERAEKGGAEE